MAGLVPPHGGKLIPLSIHGAQREDAIKEAGTLSKVRLTSREISDLIMLGMGAFSPLEGFMVKEDYESVIAQMRLENGFVLRLMR